MNIGIYTTEDWLDHKKDGGDCHWHLHPLPLKLKVGDKIYFATKGKWRGYFVIDGISTYDSSVYFEGTSWTPIEFLGKWTPRKPFQGFTYKVPDSSNGGF